MRRESEARACFCDADVFLSHGTALAYYRSGVASSPGIPDGFVAHYPRTSEVERRFRETGSRSLALACVAASRIGVASGPVDLLVPRRRSRYTDRDVRCHVFATNLPGHPFVEVVPRVFVASPGLLFSQIAAMLTAGLASSRIVPFAQLASLGYEFCGSYSLDGGNRGFLGRKPVASVAGLSLCLAEVGPVAGAKLARRALGFTCDGAASPAEANIALLLSLPTSCGGRGIPLPRLNDRLRLDRKAAAFVGGVRGLSPDLLWWARGPHGEDLPIVMEYDSDLEHADRRSLHRDNGRRSAFREIGARVFTVTADQLYDQRRFGLVAEQLAGAAGWRVPRQNRMATDELRRVLLG